MQWVKVDDAFFTKCNSCGANSNNQLLYNEKGRPTVLLVNLKYKDNHYDFVVPMKSNISDAEDKNNYFALPPNKRTKTGFHHGIYYVKLFPIIRKYIHPYHYNKDAYLVSIKTIIDRPDHTKEIVAACQKYLEEYGKGKRHPYTPDIDSILEMLKH